MKPMYLPEVEKQFRPGIPQIFHLIAYKPGVTKPLAEFTQAVMRGPSPLSAGLRELIAAFTSKGNHCLF